MDTANRAVQERRSFWQDPLAQWHASGMTQVAYCRQHGFHRDPFGYWKKRLLAVRAPATAATATGFIAVRMASASAPVTVVLQHPLRVEVQPGFDPAPLRAVIQTRRPDVPA